MILKERIPNGFYKLFATKYIDIYMLCLIELRRESGRSYSSLGLTEQECRAVINENLVRQKVDWRDDEPEDTDAPGEDLPQRGGGAVSDEDGSSGPILSRLVRWGWLKSDYDDKLNCNVLSFPEYSQLYVELFEKLYSEDDSKERESMLAVYSYLFTYQSDEEKNNEILKSALKTSRNLGQLLSNMQDGMGTYFDELSRQREFRGIQEVLVKEINNSDSRKYTILTTTDSFYRYKEAVKELIDQILTETEQKKGTLLREQPVYEENSREYRKNKRALEKCVEAADTVCAIEREFDTIERKYNRLIEQKTIFAGRAAARIRYILQEGVNEEDNTVALINLLCKSAKRQEILRELTGRVRFTSLYKVVTDNSLYSRRERDSGEFKPQAVSREDPSHRENMEDFIPKPLYTRGQLRAFMRQHMQNGIFTAGKDAVHSAEDLEKLLFLWQDATSGSESILSENAPSGGNLIGGNLPGGNLSGDILPGEIPPGAGGAVVSLEGEYTTEDGFTYTGLVIAPAGAPRIKETPRLKGTAHSKEESANV